MPEGDIKYKCADAMMMLCKAYARPENLLHCSILKLLI